MSVPVQGLPEQLALLDRSLVIAVLNVTPDSFSDGGQYLETKSAVARGLQLQAQGADIVEVGGESTRPGAQRVSEQEELRRVLPVVQALAQHEVFVAVDTMRAAVAQAAVQCGAMLVNDVSAGLADPHMPQLLAQLQVPVVAMHWRGHSRDMDAKAQYTDVVAEVIAELQQRVQALAVAGVDPQRIIADPGLGFSKKAEHNWALLADLDRVQKTLGRPLLVGASRKRFLQSLVAQCDPSASSAADRDLATAALSAIAASARVWGVRVHNPALNLPAVLVAQAIAQATQAHSKQEANQQAAPPAVTNPVISKQAAAS